MKVGIVTINDNDNYGNRLQNYAVEQVLQKDGIKVKTLRNTIRFNNRCSKKVFVKKIIGHIYKDIIKNPLKNKKRLKAFKKFNRDNINFTREMTTIFSKINNKYDYFIVGSDQVWKPTYGRLSDMDVLAFADSNKRIAFSASFGISELDENAKTKVKNEISKFKSISVREDSGKKIIKDSIKREDIEVLVDPTMLLTSEEWDKVSKKPVMLKTDKYILNYFLGELSEERKKEIDRIAKENDCEVINILDENSPFYQTGPSEFLYLEKNAFLICTDSFHSTVFSILYNRPFIVFNREDAKVNMNSRIETLMNKFDLNERYVKNHLINNNLLYWDYTKAYKILEKEREKSKRFLEKALDIK